MKLYSVVLALALGFTIAGCTNQTALSEQAIMKSYPAVANLQSQLMTADANNVELLSPQKYKTAQVAFKKSLQLAKSDNARADQVARSGLGDIKQASKNADNARYVFEDVLKVREKAKNVGANQYSIASFKKADQALLELTTLLENGKSDKAKAGRAAVTAMYSALELTALKGDTVDRVKDAIALARKNDVDDLAPKTFKLAEEELSLASNVLDADRSGRAKAEKHAKAALFHVQRATEIGEVIKIFNTSDFTQEDIVLWYQGELSEALKPVNANLAFNQQNKMVIKGINQQLATLTANYARLGREKNDAIAALTLEKEQLMSSAKAMSEKDKAIAAKFGKIQNLFASSEANVYRKIDNVLISAHGFQFPSGKSEIESANFALLNKITAAIKEFPNSIVIVAGHTDGQGDDNSNKKLSQDRADKVVKFLVEVGGISAKRVTGTGYGEEKPVASNETVAGRAANRRVEILIDNTAGL